MNTRNMRSEVPTIFIKASVLLLCFWKNALSEPCYPAGKPSEYKGYVNTTAGGYPCMTWSSQAPHQHTSGGSASDFIDGRFPDNFCRNPLSEKDTLFTWCYTTDPKKRWGKCDVPVCDEDLEVVTTATCHGSFVAHGGNCYAYITQPETWSTAEATCRALGATLAEVFTRDQNEFLKLLVTGSSAWIGGHDLIREGYWSWATSDIELSHTFQDWKANEPNSQVSDGHPEEDCLELLTNKPNDGWNDKDCHVTLPFVCQKAHIEVIG